MLSPLSQLSKAFYKEAELFTNIYYINKNNKKNFATTNNLSVSSRFHYGV